MKEPGTTAVYLLKRYCLYKISVVSLAFQIAIKIQSGEGSCDMDVQVLSVT